MMNIKKIIASLVLICCTQLFLVGNLWADAYQDSLQNILETGSQIDKREATFLLGEYLVQRNPEQSEAYANKLKGQISFEEDSAEWTRLNYIFGASHRWQGNYKTALEYYQLNYDFFKRYDDSLNIAKTGRFIGSINMFLGNNALAQKHLLECANIYNEIGSLEQKAYMNNSLASLYLNIDQLKKGEERYLEALEQFTEINDSAGMSSCNANLGMVYTDLGEFEKAEMHLMKQKALNAVFPTLREMGFHHDFLGMLRQEQGRLQDAYNEHLKALKIREGLSSSYNLCESKLNTSDVLIQLGRNQEAINHLKGVLSFEEHNSLNQETSAHELLSEAYENLGNYTKALDHYKSYKAISDSIYNESSIQIIAEKDAYYKKKEQDAEIAILNVQNEITQERLSRSHTLIYGSLFGLAIFSLLSFFIFLMYRKIKGKNAIIKKALSDKDLLIHEIHHRVKNNLQVISSLLKLQSRFITDESALEAIKDGRNRVQSMAILHKNLYREENLTGVNMKTYFSNLTQGIFNSYNLSQGEIKLDMEIDDVNLDIDTVIPIGLITNELITNSLKYAFEEGYHQAKINVKLTESKNNYELTVSDNGIGIKDEVIQQTPNKTFGQRMINAFAEKLKAKIQINNDEGTQVIINIPKMA